MTKRRDGRALSRHGLARTRTDPPYTRIETKKKKESTPPATRAKTEVAYTCKQITFLL
jgi:hypothetical protein